MGNFQVAGYTKDEVNAGVHVYIANTFSEAVFEENKKLFNLSSQGIHLKEVPVIIYATRGSNSPPSRLIDKLGKYYSYIFLNEGSRILAEKHGIGLRLIGEVEEGDKPEDAILLVKSAYVTTKDT
ncbi:MAG: hypothetical protein D5R97_09825 [Candidatus Syntrophonatronum acetioxidans]|uniref:Uncharacterized protein n=1 Tax=Candidatus Syntrophonatronum acetioxidans TaxID=1795816 RepID=A0A424Y9S0_9FIRM|nr:MAG: hypothetical protein D5R97_09825 [Candidatus Syntrophonatronum acetioxidans]